MEATKLGYVNVVKAILEHGSIPTSIVARLVNLKGPDSASALSFAIQFNHLEIFQELVKHGANVNIQSDDGTSPLHLTLTRNPGQEQNQEKVAMFLELIHNESIDVNILDFEGNTPLMIASDRGLESEVSELLDCKNIMVDAQSFDLKFTALTLASANQYTNVAGLLIEKGNADVDLAEKTGSTAIDYAIATNNVILEQLIKKHLGAKYITKISKELLQMITSDERYTEADIISLLKKGADPNYEAESGFTPILIATVIDKFVPLLLSFGAKIDQPNIIGKIPLSYAAQFNHPKLAKMLIDLDKTKKTINQQDFSQRSPLHWAALHNQVELIDYLVSHGANTQARDVNGDIPLYLASTKEAKTLLG